LPNRGSILTLAQTINVATQAAMTIQKKLMNPWGESTPKMLGAEQTSCSHPAAIPGIIIPKAKKAVQKA